jgi:PAB1-binding protein PBP1
MELLFAFETHHRKNPWEDAPHWALELREMLSIILKREERLMSAATDLNNAVTALATGFAALDTAVHAELTALQDALANDNTDAINQAIANISAVTNKMAGDAAALTASIPAATTVPPPAPAPTPAVTPTVSVPVIDTPPVTEPSATPPAA